MHKLARPPGTPATRCGGPERRAVQNVEGYRFMSKVSGSRLGIVVVVQRNGKNTCALETVGGRKVGRRYSAKKHLLCNAVAAGVMNSVSTYWHGIKVDRPPEVTPVQRACAYMEQRSGLLDVADRHAVTSRCSEKYGLEKYGRFSIVRVRTICT